MLSEFEKIMEHLKEVTLKEIKATKSLEELREVKIKYLGRNGIVNKLFKMMK